MYIKMIISSVVLKNSKILYLLSVKCKCKTYIKGKVDNICIFMIYKTNMHVHIYQSITIIALLFFMLRRLNCRFTYINTIVDTYQY